MMAPSEEDARKLARKGVIFVCASCSKMHEGLALGKEGCTGVKCGSPVRRRDFPEYEGNLKDMSELCMACGSEEVLATAMVEGSDRKFGLCKDHLELIDRYIAPEEGILVSTKKVLIFPRSDRAMSHFIDAVHTI